MEPKIHIHLHVSDLARSREFYEKFLGAPPVKTKPGYLKFLPDFAPLNLALSEIHGHKPAAGAESHFGIQLDSSATVLDHLRRVKAAGIPVREEIGVNCCHANQDKFWARDPDGAEWEIYHLNYDIEESGAKITIAAQPACCG
ncbi:VOC family protein [Candidatus Sumerlaeota bacterium]|nr:VOC family protein [Candidatus Sumerlaeota bacterium]